MSHRVSGVDVLSVCDINSSVLAHVFLYLCVIAGICHEFKCPETHKMRFFASDMLRKTTLQMS